MKTIKLLCLSGAITFLAACNQTQHTVSQARSNAQSFAATANQATIFVYRDQGTAATESTYLELNGEYLGHTYGHTFVKEVIEPGTYTLLSRTDNMPALQIQAEPNAVYYVRQKISKGPTQVHSDLYMVDETKAQTAIRNSRMVN